GMGDRIRGLLCRDGRRALRCARWAAGRRGMASSVATGETHRQAGEFRESPENGLPYNPLTWATEHPETSHEHAEHLPRPTPPRLLPPRPRRPARLPLARPAPPPRRGSW